MSKSGSHFQFKKFTVWHDQSSMKVGTDGVLLGAWARVDDVHYALDIGTGTGLIALMLAQRSGHNTVIDAVELTHDDAQQAIANVARSPWPEKITIHHMAIQNFTSHRKYDLIISNPPYFNNSQRPPDSRRHTTRHTTQLDYAELIDAARTHLADHGRFNIILPATEGLLFMKQALDNGLFCARQWSFRARPEKAIERWLMEFVTTPGTIDTGELILYDQGEEWSDSYKALTGDFYLRI